ncbi:hypothetical protein VHEMI09617 [[Torrubiella] hemipterigena]|uniref:Uncharacterized protein n=1 Tax=[Torrubiella] hemipterigena TaxID=1531966 RepID=A0A0A1TRT5_9HYPO|nr:hypothetical protein VHEMI09617 [[Torrubiella] hemipterigena]
MADRRPSTDGHAWAPAKYFNTQHPAVAIVHTAFALLGFLVFLQYTLISTRGVLKYLSSRYCSIHNHRRRRASPLSSWSLDASGCQVDEKAPSLSSSSPISFRSYTAFTMHSQLGLQGPGSTSSSPATKSTESLRSSKQQHQQQQPALSLQTDSDIIQRHFITRLPPAPPLTPPELSSTIFTSEDRRQNLESFMHQPNPDYMAETAESDSLVMSQPTRRSYTKTLPISIPTPQTSTMSTAPDAEQLFISNEGAAATAFSPSSYPPRSPVLPPAPPGAAPSTPGHDASPRRNIDIKGEIISAVDGQGAGWTRHTRVYGGGVCLACQSSGAQHGHGGFYGANVRPEEMRR